LTEVTKKQGEVNHMEENVEKKGKILENRAYKRGKREERSLSPRRKTYIREKILEENHEKKREEKDHEIKSTH